jgi:hypothetical protein
VSLKLTEAFEDCRGLDLKVLSEKYEYLNKRYMKMRPIKVTKGKNI